jgi:energy-coupling factor transporter ATP-binding protein EcfA2
MIKRIRIKNFKSLREVDLALGRLNLFIGTNASGKSNLLDVLPVLRRLVGGYSITTTLEGGVQTTAGDTLPGLRGGLANAIYRAPGLAKPSASAEARLEVEIATEHGLAGYQIAFNGQGTITQEILKKDDGEVFFFDGREAFFRKPDGILTPSYPDPDRGSWMIHGFVDGRGAAHAEFIRALVRALQTMQFLELDPDVLRCYGSKADVRVMGGHGENFASVVRHICSGAGTKGPYVNWLREMRPHEVDDIATPTGVEREPKVVFYESGREFPASVLSAGTLRFAALAAAFFQPSMPQVLTIEEVENGIHGSRLRLLLELLRTQAAAAKTQVLATTHSPLLLAWLKPEEYETTFLCKRDEETGESRILPLTQVPHFNEIIGKQPITELFAEGWMEAAV